MKRRRKVIVEIATSADGYIARLDGDVSWLDRPQPKGHYGMGAFMKSIDTILWGRKTYTKGIEMGMKDGGFGPKIKNYLFTRQPQRSLLPGFELVKEPIKPFAQRLRAYRSNDPFRSNCLRPRNFRTVWCVCTIASSSSVAYRRSLPNSAAW
jgi:dihydrofolate reductase